jgi:hypothetical protein
MLFRFSEVDPLENGEYDFDNAKFIGAIEHKDYVEYTKLLHYMQEQDYDIRPFGNIELVKQIMDTNGNVEDRSNIYTIVDISFRIPLDKVNLECMEVYVSPT